MDMDKNQPHTDWAQLVCVTDIDTPPFLIGKDKFTIGRQKGNDIVLENNMHVSSTHCYILRDEDGRVWLCDTSTNGTLLNSSSKLTKGQLQEITHGDEFFVVHKKGDTTLKIGYVFQDLTKLREEAAEDSSNLDQTFVYDIDYTLPDNATLGGSIKEIQEKDTMSTLKRKLTTPDEQDSCPLTKLKKADTAGEAISCSGGSGDLSLNLPVDTRSSNMDAKTIVGDSGEVKALEGQTEVRDIAQQEKENMGQPAIKTDQTDFFADTLTCIICQDILHDCISLQPCMHSFCCGCYSEWMIHSSECPSCRGRVERINKNHIVNNLVDAYLKEHPEKRRPEEDIKELDAKNKITRDMLFQKQNSKSSSEYEDSDDSDDSYGGVQISTHGQLGGIVFGFGTPLFGTTANAYKAVCRQCPGQSVEPKTYGETRPASSATVTGNFINLESAAKSTCCSTSQTSTSRTGPSEEVQEGAFPNLLNDGMKTMPTVPAYTCKPNQNHVMCQCCLQIFPDRRAEGIHNPGIPPQQCFICYRAFCHAYWGCRRADCRGCLALFQDMNFGEKVLTGLILDNRYESEVFSNYLKNKRLTVHDVHKACIDKLKKGTYSCPDQIRHNISAETPLCFTCALRNFKAMAYQYRTEIPLDQFPAEVTARADCYWGKNCRTQHSKPEHAIRFNHVCEQSRI